MILEDLLERLEDIEVSDTYLYFITRVLKQNQKKNSKVLDKYLFKVYQVDINDEIRNHLYSLTQEQLSYLINKKTEVHEYDVITDDTQHLFTYSMTNKVMSFADVVNNQLKAIPPKITSLEEIIENEELWAYCVGFQNQDEDNIFTFRKILAGKVAIDEKDSNNRKWIPKALRTVFNTKSQKLELIQGETVNLDKQVDCLYYNDIFYIAKKTQFEQIVGLEEEYKKQAKEVLTQLEETKMITGLEIINQQIESNPSIHKKLVRLTKIGNYKGIDTKAINKMQRICKKYGNQLNVKDGKLHIESENDIDLTLKMLADYYKKGEVSLREFIYMPLDNDILTHIYVKKDGRKTAYESFRMTETDFPTLTCAMAMVDGRFETVLGARPKHAEVVIDEELADSLSKEDVASYAKRVIDKLQYGSNIRGSKQYRKQLSKVLISRCISRLTEE